MKAPLAAVPNRPSQETIKRLETLLAQAKRGQLIGLAYAAVFRKRAYTVDTTGEAQRDPTFARGMVATLHDELGKKIASSKSAPLE